MAKNFIKTLAFAGALSMAGSAHALLVVSSGQTADNLVNSLLAGSSGITTSNATLVGTSVMNGTFSGGTSASLGFDQGIVLSSGSVDDLPLASSGAASGADSDQGQPGDTKLSAIVSDTTNDASVLSFDFVPNGNQVTFSYVFGSTEYNGYVNSSFNDVFAFFVNDVNYALIPGTSTPVSINNVNCGQNFGPAPGLPGDPGTSNCDKFRDNRNQDGTVGANALVNLGGLTNVFSFVAPVNPNVTNTMYLAIADTSDSVLDSAVFLQGGTFSTCGGPGQPPCGGTPPPPPLPEPASLALMGIGLAGLGLSRRRRKS